MLNIDNEEIKIVVGESDGEEAYMLATECDYDLILKVEEESEHSGDKTKMIDILKQHISSFHNFTIRGVTPEVEKLHTYPFSFIVKIQKIYLEAMKKIAGVEEETEKKPRKK